jgi:hypothetical protein
MLEFFETILEYTLFGILIGTSVTVGFFLTSVFINKVNQEANIEDIDDGIHVNSFIEELEIEPMSNLSEEDLLKLKNEYIILDLQPLLKQTIRMYYDRTEDAFCYYSERETIYKYLDIIARCYVVDYHCKQVYVELGEAEEKVVDEVQEIVGPFVSKKNVKKKIFEKKLLRFIYKGTERDFSSLNEKKNNNNNDINILDFLKMQKRSEDSDEYENITKED